MREISHVTGIIIGGAAIILTAGGLALTPAARGHASDRPPAASRMRDPQARAAGQPAGIRFAGIRPGSPMAAVPGGQPRHGSFGTKAADVRSTNWAGYAATRPRHPFRYLQATFFVPYINCSTNPDSFSAHWAGLDGFDTGTVEQAGVLAACRGGTPAYDAWYEMFPDFPVYPNIAVRPGDSVTVGVFYRKSANRFEISLTDNTNGRHFTRVLACPHGATCHRASAEVISEPPSSGDKVLLLTDFRAASFTGIRLTDQAGFRGTLRPGRWATARITTVSMADGAVIDQPIRLFQGQAFDNYWMRSS
jgi:Peptidase A4 family